MTRQPKPYVPKLYGEAGSERSLEQLALEQLASAPRRSDACLSDLELDQLVATRERSARMQGHLADCDRCRARLTSFQAAAAQCGILVGNVLRRARDEIEHKELIEHKEQATNEPFARTPMVRAFSRAPLLAGFLLLASAASGLTIALLPGTLLHVGPSSTVSSPSFGEHSFGVHSFRGHGDGSALTDRSKGTAVRMYLRRAGEVRRARSGDLFQAGDQLRFVIRTPGSDAAFFLMLGLEAGGKVMTYYPFGGERSMRVATGTEIQLPDSLVLDAAPGDELLLSLFSSAPIEVEKVKALLLERGPPFTLDRLIDLDLDLEIPQAQAQAQAPGTSAHWTVLRKD